MEIAKALGLDTSLSMDRLKYKPTESFWKPKKRAGETTIAQEMLIVKEGGQVGSSLQCYLTKTK